MTRYMRYIPPFSGGALRVTGELTEMVQYEEDSATEDDGEFGDELEE
jgi:hypothetical protein